MQEILKEGKMPTKYTGVLSNGCLSDFRNEAGGIAHRYAPRHALAQFALTGCLNRTCYVSAESQRDQILALCKENTPEYVAKTAIYARQHGNMKDVPALMCAYLSKYPDAFTKAFSRIIDNSTMLRSFVRIIRSGNAGRKSLGTAPKRMVQHWFEARTPTEIFLQSVGKSPSIASIIKLSHPKPTDNQRDSLYAWLLGKNAKKENLPGIVKEFETWKAGGKSLPNVPFEMLTSRKLDQQAWMEIAKRAKWRWTLKNLNTMTRHNLFNEEMSNLVAKKLSDPEAIQKSRCFPYEIMAAYLHANNLPRQVKDALHVALEIATKNVPVVGGSLAICLDVSASMLHPITGKQEKGRWNNKAADSKVKCVDVASLMACSLLRQNPTALVVPFNVKVVSANIDPRDSVLTNSARIGKIAKGGTACSCALKLINEKKLYVDSVVMISDNQSWCESLGINRTGVVLQKKTELQRQWEILKDRLPVARMVCLDISPFGTAQTEQTRDDILNVGGWSDSVFSLVGRFFSGGMEGTLEAEIDKIEL